MTKTRSEDTLIINALTPGITEMDPVYNALTNYTNIKKDNDKSSRFNIIFFQEDGPNYLESFTLNPEYITSTLKSLEPVIVEGNVGGGLFLGIAMIIDVFKKISEKRFRLLILTDSGTPKIAKLYMPVLETMIDQIKNMPLVIDFVRIDVNETTEYSKLIRLTALSNGNIYKVKGVSSLSSILEIAALRKEEATENFTNSDNFVIPKENQRFYINLADIPEELKKPQQCSICFKKNYNAIVKCPNCGVVSHKICLSLWSERSSIGIPHVFRCQNCYNLIKLEKEFVRRVRLAKMVEESKILPQKDITDIHEYLINLEPKDGPKIVHIDDPMGIPSEEFVESELLLIEEELDARTNSESQEDVKFILCPHCFKMITNQYKRCPNCHHVIKK